MIELKDIQFSYTKKGSPALSGVTASIEPGIHLLAGENGAGKTTLLHVLAGLLHPRSGIYLKDGVSFSSDEPRCMGSVFLLEENMWLPAKNIRRFAELHSGFYPNFSHEAFMDNLKEFGMTGEEKMKHLSLGNRKKAQLAYVLALGVDLLLLDEPTNALDIESKESLKRIIARSVNARQTIIVATHTVSDLEYLFDGAIILHRSEVVMAATEEEVAEAVSFTVTPTPDPDALYSEMQLGRTLNILPASEEETTRVDWRLLYSALHSASKDKIVKVLHSEV